jgi:hypothetical protein
VIETAWFDTKHPGERVTCPTCDAPVGKPCVTVDAGERRVPITGMHADRVQLGREQWAK